MKRYIKNKGFTFVELIVTTIIIGLLSSIGFYSYISYLPDARDSKRLSDLSHLEASLKEYKGNRGAYPLPGNYFALTNSGYIVAYQGLMNNKVSLSTLDNLPTDPHIKVPYFYSVSKNRQEFELALTLENGDFSKAELRGDYKSVSKNVLPTIMTAYNGPTDLEIDLDIPAGATNRNFFIFNREDNLPYTMTIPYEPYYAGIDINTILLKDELEYWQNIDYMSCTEIDEAGKSISGSGILETYQILNNSGSLTDTGCTF